MTAFEEIEAICMKHLGKGVPAWRMASILGYWLMLMMMRAEAERTE